MVLSDELFQLLSDFHHNINKKSNNDKLEALFSYLRNPILTNITQLRNLRISDKSYWVSLCRKYPHLQALSLEDLSQYTLYKIILTTDCNKQLPYYNILDKKGLIHNTFSMSLNIGQNRFLFKEYLKQQLKKAKELYIFDPYFAQRWDITKELFTFINLSYNISIHLHQNLFYDCVKDYNAPNQNGKELNIIIKTLYPNCQVIKETSHPYFANKKHDRFIIINNEIELIFSSGIDNFLNPKKNECTLIIRKLI